MAEVLFTATSGFTVTVDFDVAIVVGLMVCILFVDGQQIIAFIPSNEHILTSFDFIFSSKTGHSLDFRQMKLESTPSPSSRQMSPTHTITRKI